VVLDWPLVAAVLHTGGAAALMTVLAWAAVRQPRAGRPWPPRRRPPRSGEPPGGMTAPHGRDPCRPRCAATRWRQYYVLTKPRVVQLIVFCAVIGMLLAEPGLPDCGGAGRWRPCRHLAGGSGGRGLQLPGRAAHRRPHGAPPGGPRPRASSRDTQTLVFSAVLCAAWAALCCTGGSTR
jgi:hypothetical protein